MFEIPDVPDVAMDSLADVLLGTALATAALWWCVKTLVRRTAQPTQTEAVPRKTVVNVSTHCQVFITSVPNCINFKHVSLVDWVVLANQACRYNIFN